MILQNNPTANSPQAFGKDHQSQLHARCEAQGCHEYLGKYNEAIMVSLSNYPLVAEILTGIPPSITCWVGTRRPR